MRSSRRSPRTLKRGQRADDPFFQARHEAAHVRPALLEVEHHIGHALARPVVGHLPAAAALEHRETRLDQLAGLGAGAGGVKGRVLEQPDQLALTSGRDGGGAGVHDGHSGFIGHRLVAHAPFHRRRPVRRRQPDYEFVAYAAHRCTIASRSAAAHTAATPPNYALELVFAIAGDPCRLRPYLLHVRAHCGARFYGPFVDPHAAMAELVDALA